MTLTENKFKRTTIAGVFKNIDLPDASDLANGYFQRNVQIGGDLDISGNIINVGLTNALNSKVSVDGSGYIINTELENALNSKVSMDTSGNIINSILDDQLASKASIVYVDDKIAQLVDSSPATLDTLNELANALGDDPNFATTISNNIGLKADKTYTDTQLALKANIISPTFSGSTVIGNLVHTGTINSPAIQTAINNTIATARNTLVSTNSTSTIGSYLHFGNHAQAYTGFGTQAFGAISVNKGGGGNAEMNFIQNGSIPGSTYRAFNFMTATSNTTFDELMRINKNGDLIVTGNVTTPTINATTSIISPTITNINTNIGLKSDLTYVDAQLLLKDNVTSVDNKLLLKSDKTYVDAQLLLKDTVISVDNKLLLKSDKTYVDNALSNVDDQLLLKDDITSVNSKLLLKSDKTYVDSALSSINNEFTTYDTEILNLQNQINNIEGNYNPSSDVTFQNLTVSGTITNTALTNLINSKANIANPSFTGTTNIVNFNNTGTFNSPALQTLLNTYALTSAMNTALNLKANLSLVSNVNNTSDANKPVSTAQQTALDLKLNKTGDTLNTATLTGTTYFNGNVYQNANAGFYWYLNDISTYSSRLILGGYDAMVWDNPTATDIRFRWGATNIQRHTFSSNGALAIAGNFAGVNGTFTGPITSPTITTINSSITTINNNISNVNNTSDANKPVSTAQQTALDSKANINNASLTGTTNIVNLNHTGTINSPSIQTAINNTITTARNTLVSTNSASTIGSYLHFGNHAQGYTEYGTQGFGSISVNKGGGGHAEMNFIQNGAVPGATYRAFNFMTATSNTTFTELMRINKNGDMVVTGNLTSPNITTMNTNIGLKSDTSYVNAQLALKDDITSVDSKLTNYASLNSSPTFTGDVKAKLYSGGVNRIGGTTSFEYTASSLPSTIIADGANNLGYYGIPDMPIGTRFTVMKTTSSVNIYSTDPTVFFYLNRKNERYVVTFTQIEDSRTYIRAEIVSKANGNTIKVWMTESSHTYNETDNVRAQAIGAWMLDGANFGRTAGTYRPIMCSTKVFGPGNSDDGFIVMPGYSIGIYPNENYGGTPVWVNNIYDHPMVKPLHHSSSPTNDMQSIKLYYGAEEITIDGISN